MSAYVKICGIRDDLTLNAVASAGADFAGFVHYPASPRHLAIDAMGALIARAPKTIATVAVLVDPGDALLEAVAALRPDYLQLHGSESPERVGEIAARYRTPVIKAVGIKEAADLFEVSRYLSSARALLLDAKPSGGEAPGGLGRPFDWSILRGFSCALPWFLSGGLNAANVAEAIAVTGAAMVDVSSGVERAPGEKDGERVQAFIEAAKGCL